MLMESLLQLKEYWMILEDNVLELPTTLTLEQNKFADEGKLKNLKTKNYLFHLIERGIKVLYGTPWPRSIKDP